MRSIFLFYFLVLALLIFSSPLPTYASNHCGGVLPCPPATPTCGVGTVPYVACPPSQSSPQSTSLQNPLAFPDIQSFIGAVLNVLIVILTPIVIIFIILAGFKYVTAQGNASKIEEATKALTYAVIGGVLIIGAVTISQIIGNLVTTFGS